MSSRGSINVKSVTVFLLFLAVLIAGFAAHLLVSICMLASLVVAGWIAYRELGALQGGLLILGVSLLPGVIVSSMGVLSENLYLLCSLLTILLYFKIRASDGAPTGWILSLLLLVSFTIMTRTIGVALALAIVFASVQDQELTKRQKISFLLVGVFSLVSWQLWGAFTPDSGAVSYFDTIAGAVGSIDAGASLVSVFWKLVLTNLVQIVSSFNHYLSLSHANSWFFLFSMALLMLCLYTLGLRLYQRKFDAIYLSLYLAILAIWPFPEEMMRFLHPVMLLLILQPALYSTHLDNARHKRLFRGGMLIVTGVLIVNSMVVQASMVQLRDEARANNPGIVHSFHYYYSTQREMKELLAKFHAAIMDIMADSADYIPPGQVVAAVKHEHYAILADRQAVPLLDLTPFALQLCNLEKANVDAIFLSHLTTTYNRKGVASLEAYEEMASRVLSLSDGGAAALAHMVFLDKAKMSSRLESWTRENSGAGDKNRCELTASAAGG